jgi:mRNA interferase RelE/StbE
MSYKIELATSAERDLKKLTKDVYLQVRKIIYELAENPRPHGVETLTSYGKGKHYRVRSGNYRIIYQIFDDIVSVQVVKIGHRREIYER